jgi:hypothetical protein
MNSKNAEEIGRLENEARLWKSELEKRKELQPMDMVSSCNATK